MHMQDASIVTNLTGYVVRDEKPAANETQRWALINEFVALVNKSYGKEWDRRLALGTYSYCYTHSVRAYTRR